jgi:hypothetical protein
VKAKISKVPIILIRIERPIPNGDAKKRNIDCNYFSNCSKATLQNRVIKK